MHTIELQLVDIWEGLKGGAIGWFAGTGGKMKRERRIGTRLLILGILWIILGISGKGYAVAPEALQQGNKVQTYPVKKGSVKVYTDADLKEVQETVPGKSLLVTVTGLSGDAWYGKYKIDGKVKTGWFSEKTFLVNPSYEKEDGLARYAIKAYSRKKGDSWGEITAYSGIDIIGKSGKWYQVIYPVKTYWRIGWITQESYTASVRPYDGSEKRVMSEGIYTIRPKSSSTKRMAASGTTPVLAATSKKKAQQFEFFFYGDNNYQIVSVKTGFILAAEKDETGAPTGGVVFAGKTTTVPPEQLWHLTRTGGYYYLVNQAAGTYLRSGETFTLGAKSSAAKFRLSMYGGKNRAHWRVFSQYDADWGARNYGRTNTMAASACGIFSMVNALYALNGQFIDPVMLADFAVKKHYRIEGSGTVSTVFAADGKKYGSKYGFKYVGSTTSLAKLKKHLQNNGTAVAYVPGHYMAVGDYRSGKYLALDSAATAKRATSPYGCWVSGSRFLSGSLRAKAFFLFKAID